MKDLNLWSMVRELAEIVRNDKTDALDYIDKSVSLDGISGEDSYDFMEATMKYREWYDKLIRICNSPCIAEPEPIGRDEFLKTGGSQIAFFSFAQDGAMGSAGEVCYITKECRTRYFNYLHGDISYDDFLKVLPAFSNCDPFAEKNGIPRGWRFYYIGDGNLLFYRAAYEEAFKARCESLYNDHDAICAEWQDMAIDILMQC